MSQRLDLLSSNHEVNYRILLGTTIYWVFSTTNLLGKKLFNGIDQYVIHR